MIGTSLYKLSEQVSIKTGNTDPQTVIEAVKQSYATCAKTSFYEGKAEGTGEIDGAFIYTFKNIAPLLDLDVDTYYVLTPSSYLSLPHSMGINQVSYMKSSDKPMVNIGNAGVGLFAGLKSYVLGGHGAYFVENMRIYFPKMTNNTVGNILLKLAIALDEVDVDEELNIPVNIQDMIVQMTVNKFLPPKIN